MTRAIGPGLPLMLTLVYPTESLAYVGPSLGLGVIGTLLAVVAVTLLSLFAFVVTPIRRYLKKRRQASAPENPDQPG